MQQKLKAASYSEQFKFLPWYLINRLKCTVENILMSLNTLFKSHEINKVSYIHCFFLVSSTAVFFSALHAKHFEIWKNPLWNWWVDCFIAQSISWCDISEFSKWIHFPFHCVFFLKKTVFPLTLLSLVYHCVNQLRYLEYFFFEHYCEY